MTDLKSLIERVEKANGPCGDLEAEIWFAVTDGATRNKWSYVHKATGQECTVDETRDKFGHLVSVPRYMESLDAVMALMPDGLEYNITNIYGTAHVDVGLNVDEQHSSRREDGNITLALLSAILKSRLATNGGGAE